MKHASLRPGSACLRAAMLLLFLAALSYADEPIATYNGSLAVDANAGNVSAGTDMSSQINFNVQNPPSAPTPPADTYYPPKKEEEKVTHAPVKEVASEIKGNAVLKGALSEIFGSEVTDEKIAEFSKASEEVIARITPPSRSLDVGASASTLFLSFEYRGAGAVSNFVVYDTVPKSFAGNANQITITAPGAVVRIVVADPVYTFTYPTLSPGQKVEISYTVNARVNKSVINETTAPVLIAEKIKAAAVTPPPEGEKPKPPEEKPPAVPEKPPAAPEKPLEEIAKAPVTKLVILVLLLLAAIAIVFLGRRPAGPKPPHRSAPPGSMPLKPPQKKRGKGKGRKAGEVTILEGE